ncbi:MAG: hypothetical protein C0501_02910 [Isosphaera sp.]|nr:hypothetical protein [Isosphaera sp.]
MSFFLPLVMAAPPAAELPIPDYDGRVVSVTASSITIRRGAEPPRTFPVGPDLAAGRFPADEVDGYRYRLSDVAVGDVVSVHCGYAGGANVCRAVSIARRPGGKVPPAHLPAGRAVKYHDVANAWQAWEEKGTPLPAWARPPR